jgi:hypothetical protein
MFSSFTSPVVTETKLDKNLDKAAYMEFEFMNRAPVRPGFFTEIFQEKNIVQVIASNANKSAIIPIFAFLDVGLSQARVYYMRVLSSLSESEIKNVLKIRNGDPILPNEPTLVDLMIFITQFDRLAATSSQRGRVPGLLQRYGLSRALQVEDAVSPDCMRDILSMLIACLTCLAEKDYSIAFIVRSHIQNFKARLELL